MSETEKPLHVRVAEALGWTHLARWTSDWKGKPPAGAPLPYGCNVMAMDAFWVPRYDTDWAATGPLVEKYGFDLNHFGDGNPSDCADPRTWFARKEVSMGEWVESEESPTPPIAICNLILALHEAGKL